MRFDETWRGCVLCAVIFHGGCDAPSERAPATAGAAGEGGQASSASELALELVAFDEDGALNITPGGALPVVLPPQGGFVAMVGVKARGLLSPQVVLTGTLRPIGSNEALSSNRRTVLLSEGALGLHFESEDSGEAVHLLLCPNSTDQTFLDEPYELVVNLRSDEQQATASVEVAPVCARGDASIVELCHCACAPGYQPGHC